MEVDINKIKIRIIKLLSIADDASASDNEVYVAVQKAQRLMTEYNINRREILHEKEYQENVECHYFDKMYPRIYNPIVAVIANNFRCKVTYQSYRQNVHYSLYGLQADLDTALIVLNKVFSFLKIRLDKYVKQYKKDFKKTCDLIGLGVAKADSRVIKRSYCSGFASGLVKKFEENLIELQKKYGDETALAIVGIPAEVEKHINEVIKPRKVKNRNTSLDDKAYSDGKKDGMNFKT